MKIKVLERTGPTIKSKLQKSNPFKRDKCEDNCLICKTNGKGLCETQGITYEIKCKSCEEIYIGETSRNAKKRGNEHLQQLKNKSENSVLWRHCKEKHEDIEQNFIMNITGIYHNNAMERQIAEAVNIKNRIQNNMNIMNNKTEWNQQHLPSLCISRT